MDFYIRMSEVQVKLQVTGLLNPERHYFLIQFVVLKIVELVLGQAKQRVNKGRVILKE
jgi:hypothetical protein